MKTESLLERKTGLFSLAEQHDTPVYKDPEPKGCQSLRLARSAETENCMTVISELIVKKGHEMKEMLNDPDMLLKSIMVDQITEYRALSGGLLMAILTSSKNGVIPEELIPLYVEQLNKIGIPSFVSSEWSDRFNSRLMEDGKAGLLESLNSLPKLLRHFI
jgi:hypothetical protein